MDLIILVGNIGTGKSTVAKQFTNNTIIVNMDTIQAMISGGEYGNYDTNKKVIYQAIETTAIESALENGFNVVVDRTNMDKKRRKRFIEIGKRFNANVICYNLGVGDRESCVNNRMKESRNITQECWESVYDTMFDNYEPPTNDEGFKLVVHIDDCYVKSLLDK